MQEERQRTLADTENRAKLENEQQMEGLERAIRQERERLAREKAAHKKAEEEAKRKQDFLEMKASLLDYKFGSRIGLSAFQDLDVSDVDNIRIVLIGPTGSGKTSFIGELSPPLTLSLLSSKSTFSQPFKEKYIM